MKVRRQAIILIAAFSACMWLIESTQGYVISLIRDDRRTWIDLALHESPLWIILGLLAPAVIAFANRYRLGAGGSVLRRAAMHVVGGLIFTALALAVLSGLMIIWYPSSTYGSMLESMATTNASYMLAIYWIITGLAHAAAFYSDSRDRELAAVRLQKMLVDERLDALRSKLNPHFLYNTLNAISTLALQHRGEDVVQTTALLADMLRMTLDESMPQEITLQREMEIIDKYLEIQRVRFGDRLSVHREIGVDSLGAMVPAMVLQPIVENAIKHGVGESKGPVSLDIEAAARGGELHLCVRDRGRGFGSGARDGIGLGATRERLKALYGDAWRIETLTPGGGGAEVSIAIPLKGMV
jgi:two-component system LytT family sensor kinase